MLFTGKYTGMANISMMSSLTYSAKQLCLVQYMIYAFTSMTYSEKKYFYLFEIIIKMYQHLNEVLTFLAVIYNQYI